MYSSLEPWILDPGASDHMSGNKLFFPSLTYVDTLPSITLANGSQTKCQGIGQTRPIPTLLLKSVLYVPGCPFNLISIIKLTRTLPYFVTFFAFLCRIRVLGRRLELGMCLKVYITFQQQ